MALCDEQARSTKTLWLAPRSAYSSFTRSMGTCLSWTPETIKVGICILPTAAVVHPQLVTNGARRTPGPQVAPTGSEAIISDHTLSRAAGSYCSGQPTWRSQFAVNSTFDWLLMAAPSRGSCDGASAAVPRLYAGASRTSER